MASISLTTSNTSSIPQKKKQAIFSTLKKWSKQATKSNPFSKNKPDLIYPFYHLEQENCNNTLAAKNYSHSMHNATYRASTLIAQDPERILPLPELSPSQESNISPNSISSSSPKDSFMYLESEIHANSYEEACEFRRLSFGDLPITPSQIIPDSSASIKSSKLNDSLLTNTLKRNSLISQTSSGFESSNLSDDESDIQSENLQDYISPQASSKFGRELISRILAMAINNNPEESLTNFDVTNPHQFQQKSKKKNKKKLTLRNSAISKSIPLTTPNLAYPTSPISKSYKSKIPRPSLASGRFRGSFSTKSLYDPSFTFQSLSYSNSNSHRGEHAKKLSTHVFNSSTKSANKSLILSLQDTRPSQTPFKRFSHTEDTADVAHYQAQHTFWLVKQLKKTISSGGYLTSKLYIPAEAWRLEPSPLKNLEQKIQQLQNLSYQLVFMDQINLNDFVKVSDATVSLNIHLTSNSATNMINWNNANLTTFGSSDNFRSSIIQSATSASGNSSSSGGGNNSRKAKKNIQKLMPQAHNQSEGSQMKRYRQELLQFLNSCHTLEKFYNHFQSAQSISKNNQLGLNPICFLNNSAQLLSYGLLKIIREDLLILLSEYLERYREDIDH